VRKNPREHRITAADGLEIALHLSPAPRAPGFRWCSRRAPSHGARRSVAGARAPYVWRRPSGGTGSGRVAWCQVVRRLGAMLAGGLLPSMKLSGRHLRLGPECESGRLIREWMRWNVTGRWRDGEGGDYLAGLAGSRVPVLGVVGAGDRLLAPPAAVGDLLDRFGSPDRTLLVAGRATGFSIDFDHPGLIVGRRARQEIWPRAGEWLHDRRQPTGPAGSIPRALRS